MNSGTVVYRLYIWGFLIFMFAPLLLLVTGSFNSDTFPSPLPWKSFTWSWYLRLWNDADFWRYTWNTLFVALSVVAITVPLGTAGAILVNSLRGRSRNILYGLMIAPVLTPGVVIGISTLLFWYKFNVPAGLHLSVLGQSSFISAYVMLLVLARLQSFDPGLEEAALDLGASHWQSLRLVLLPHLWPAITSGAVLAFFQSVENFNTTQFTRGASNTMTVYFGSKVRSGIKPDINAFATILILVTVLVTIIYEIKRRRSAAKIDTQ